MKNKPFPVLFAFLLFFIFSGSAGTLFASQNDFYGRWLNKFTEDDMTIVITLVISESRLAMEISENYDGESPDEETVVVTEIISWREIVNSDNSSKLDYPGGFLITVREVGGRNTESLEIFISRDKTRITIPSLNEDIGYLMTFRKQ